VLRLIALIVLVVAVWLLLEWTYGKLLTALGIDRSGRRGGSRSFGPRPAHRAGERRSESLVRCAACGTYVPVSRALPAPGGGGAVCSEACRKALRQNA
jgi:hypothetical protein